ncbi:hypothetical protein HPB49_012457 [Dermacentor silvarum]|uniref:Uncharacterized protein n=1 Tax=Dermacentor silvarum TaxID=543639 RepID=A0ACB8DZR4_DERSI|nr:hypothetical protein HPB49_012457 [Dermacentor silvarum]
MGACVNRQRTLTRDLARVVAAPVFATCHVTPSTSPPARASTNHATSASLMPVSLHMRTLTHNLARIVAAPVFATRHLTPSTSPPARASTNHARSARWMPVSLHMVSKEMAPPDSQHMVRTLGVREWPYTVALEAGLVYTACHVVYYIFTQTGHKSFTHFRLTCCDAFPYSHEGCVANVCEPATFEQRHTWKRLPSDERVWDALGCHPRRALDYTDEAEQHLVRALVHHSMIVQDELGLDYSNRSGDDGEPDQVKPKKLQQTMLRRQLAVATRRRLPLVIHSRDATAVEDTHSQGDALLYRPLELGEVLAGYFPAALPGYHAVSGFLGSRTAGRGRANPLDRLLLEEDDPFFLPKRESKSPTCWLAPGNGDSRRSSPDDVITVVQENVRRIYSI